MDKTPRSELQGRAITGIKEIYAFDFDGTIVTNEFPQIGKPIANTIELIKKVKNGGHYIILNTMREGDLLLDAVKFCQNQEITFDAVNDNLPHMKEFYKNNPRKIFANYYVDDHNLFVNGVNDIQMKKMTNAEKDNDIKIFKNALDKACEIIANIARQSEACIDNCPLESKGMCHVKCEDKDAWKAYLLGNGKQ